MVTAHTVAINGAPYPQAPCELGVEIPLRMSKNGRQDDSPVPSRTENLLSHAFGHGAKIS